MAYKTRREQRYRVLLYAGCPKWEARPLSRIPQTKVIPYMKVFINQRIEEYEKAFKRARKQGISDAEFNKQWGTHIKRRYIAMGWKHRKDRWGATVAFRMIKEVKDRYRNRKPEYESPWEKRRKRWKEFSAKIDREYDSRPPRRRRESAGLRGATGDRFVG